ncbi:MAG: CarD family transcriptional regulator [Desulfobacteraceae bacterium 4484_190.1]|nr:CarD family transcriptional regulator [Deltaproteobacteria bacterium]OPX39405.1 MAG: CarD family transcriptional regulator [Desulfobacteraceae bacterium 4484_190.1]
MFNIGDMAVYPAHGVGVIEKVETQEISGCRQNFYVMRILDNNMIIMIPTSNVNNVGLREIIEDSEVPRLVSILKRRDKPLDNQTWNRRYRDYMDKIKTGSAFEVAEVYRDLLMLKLDKELSFGERKMLDTAKNLLVKEISLAKKMGEDQVEQSLAKIFS